MNFYLGRPRGSMRTSRERGDPRKFASGYGLEYFLVGESGVTLVGSVVSAWTDGTRTASQANNDMRPLYVANGVNGLPTLRFDGVDDWLLTLAFTTDQPSRVFMSMKMVTLQSAASNHDTPWSRGVTPFLIVDSTPRTILGAGTNLVHPAAIANGVWARVELVLDDDNGVILVNGAAVASGDVGAGSGGALSVGTLNGGAVHPANVEFQELFEIRGRLGSSELSRLRNRQQARLGV